MRAAKIIDLIEQLPDIQQRIQQWKEKLKKAGERLEALRTYRDAKSDIGFSISQRDLGAIIKVRYQNIDYMEKFPNGERFNGMTIEKAVEAAATFNVSLDYLLLGADLSKIDDAENTSDASEDNAYKDEYIGLLKEKIARLERENDELKVQLLLK